MTASTASSGDGVFAPRTSREPDLLEQRLVFADGPLLALGVEEHAQALHLGPERPALVVVEQLLGDQQGAAGRQPVEDALQQGQDLVLRPVVEDAAQGEQVGLGQLVREEVAGDDVDAIGDRRGPDDLPGQGHGRGQVEDRRRGGSG